MKIKSFVDKTASFLLKRLSELVGAVLLVLAILLFISLVSYSPEDPNFIFPENTEIKNLLGAKGSYTSDILYQSVGLISLLIPFSFFFISLSVITDKRILYIIRSLFFVILYSLIGVLFFTVFHTETFWLTTNGNNGFVGNLFENTFLVSWINLNHTIGYIILVILISLFFLLSINFKLKYLGYIFKVFYNPKKIPNTNIFENNENLKSTDDYITNETRIQENFTFEKNISQSDKKVPKYKLPPPNFLKSPSKKDRKLSENKIDEKTLEKILLDFGVEGQVRKVSQGPVVTLYEFEPAPGIKVSKIMNISDDLARNTSSTSARVSIIPGKNTVGIEIPNEGREGVFLREIISNENFQKKKLSLPIALGKSISGVPIIGDLTSMPHLLIAGTTGSGKSVCINTIIISLLYKLNPNLCKLILIDPKMLELSAYEGIPHLLSPVITDAKKATAALGWTVKEMNNRYKLMSKEGVRNIDGYNSKHSHKMPYIVVVVDEMSDLMLVAGKEIENYIQKLSQMARAAGIHIIMATQRPSVDVITGTIKANFPTRISFQVSSKIDSRTILGEQGAEQLLGKGDMLFMSSANRIIRIHGPYISDKEIEKISSLLRAQGEPDYIEEITKVTSEDKQFLEEDNNDEMYNKALEVIKADGKASTSYLQRKLQIGYNRAARIIDLMEERGVVSKANHVGKREVL